MLSSLLTVPNSKCLLAHVLQKCSPNFRQTFLFSASFLVPLTTSFSLTVVEEGGASPQASPTPTPTALGEPPKFGRFLSVPGTGGGGSCGDASGGGAASEGKINKPNPSSAAFLKIIWENYLFFAMICPGKI